MASARSGPGHAAGLAGSPVHQGSPTWARLSGAPGLHPPGARALAAPRAATVEHVPRRGPWLTTPLGVKVLWTPQAAPRRPRPRWCVATPSPASARAHGGARKTAVPDPQTAAPSLCGGPWQRPSLRHRLSHPPEALWNAAVETEPRLSPGRELGARSDRAGIPGGSAVPSSSFCLPKPGRVQRERALSLVGMRVCV